MSADLSELKIGSLTLTPTFSGSTTSYTASTTNETNKITAVAVDDDAEIVIKNGDTVVENGSSATWADGENTVTVKVTSHGVDKTYTVTVTKS